MSASPTIAAAGSSATTAAPACSSDNDYSPDDMGIRISTIFVILVGSLLGATFPIIAKRSRNKNLMPPIVFFIAKYFGSGVIVATAFIHLLAPATDALTDPCLTGVITDYDWAEGIALMTVFVLFFVELLIMRLGGFQNKDSGHGHDEDAASDNYASLGKGGAGKTAGDDVEMVTGAGSRRGTHSSIQTPNLGEDHLGHARDHHEVSRSSDQAAVGSYTQQFQMVLGDNDDNHDHSHVHGSYDDYAAQMTAIFILEFGVIFHSIFIGLTLAVTDSNELPILYVVLVFHQTFEGLGLGTRLAVTPWSKDRKGRLTPYFMAVGYSLSTPVAIAIGLGVRETFAPGSQTALITSGVFDSISAGILLYTGLVELMAHEFMFSETMKRAKLSVMLLAFGVMALGAGLMALLGKWA